MLASFRPRALTTFVVVLTMACTLELDSGQKNVESSHGPDSGDSTSAPESPSPPSQGSTTVDGSDSTRASPNRESDPASASQTESDGIEASSSNGSEASNSPEDELCEREACSLFDDECPQSKRCAPYICTGESAGWDTRACVPSGPQREGDPCVPALIGPFDETCTRGTMCWGGVCRRVCSGPPEQPHCESPSDHCLVREREHFAVCLSACTPLESSCASSDEACVPAREHPRGFVCLQRGGPRGPAGRGEVCSFPAECRSGMVCAEAGSVDAPGCRDRDCCTPYCRLDAPLDCPGDAERCTAVFDPPLDGLESVGTCRTP